MKRESKPASLAMETISLVGINLTPRAYDTGLEGWDGSGGAADAYGANSASGDIGEEVVN